MKIAPLTIVSLLCSSVFGQGTLIFKNDLLVHPVTGQLYDALVFTAAGAPVGPEYSAGLFQVTGGGAESLVAVTIFRATRPGHLNQLPVTIPGTLPGQSATFRVKVWETTAGSYEAAVRLGLCNGIFPTVSGNNELTITLGPLGPPPTPDAQLNGLLPLTLDCIPEPASMLIGIFGGILIFACSRPVIRARH